MNILDIGLITLIALCAIIGCYRGLIRMVYRLLSFLAALFLANTLYPPVAGAMRETALFEWLQNHIGNAMGFGANISAPNIAELPLPGPLLDILVQNNTPEMHLTLRVSTLEGYVSAFLANMVINVIAMVAVFIIVMILLTVLGLILNVVSWLPGINLLNRTGGLMAGLGLGILLVWLTLTVLTLLLTASIQPGAYGLLSGSTVAQWFFDNNWMLPLLA